MRNTVCLVLLLSLIGCKEISFRDPQPKGRRSLTGIPKKLQGKYLTYSENGELSKDTVVILPEGYRFGYFEKLPDANLRDDYEDGVLSDSLILKTFKGYYFLNIYEKPAWLLRVIQQQRNGDLIYMSMEEDDVDFNDYVKKLAKEIRIDSIHSVKKTVYHIDPAPAQLISLIKKGYFSKTHLKKIR
jgi:hypothetical protein